MNIRHTKQFRKHSKRVVYRGKSKQKLYKVVFAVYSKNIHEKHKDHALKGDWIGHRECHIQGDWLLVYRWEGDTLILVDTGSHADVFGM